MIPNTLMLCLVFVFVTIFSIEATATVLDSRQVKSLESAVQRMRANIAAQRKANKQQQKLSTTARQASDGNGAEESIDGFTGEVNDGNGIFRPIRPGTKVPAANQFPSSVSGHQADPSPDSSPDDSSNDTEDDVCFPSDSTVQASNGDIIKMKDIQLGDSIRTSTSQHQYSSVYMFTHKLHNIMYEFIKLDTASGHSITLTPSHYIYINDNELVKASVVRKDDMLSVVDMGLSKVIDISKVNKQGLFNPQTLQGDVVVNGIKASTYTSSVKISTAHAMLSPLRAVYDRLGLSFTCLDNGATRIASWLPSGESTVSTI